MGTYTNYIRFSRGTPTSLNSRWTPWSPPSQALSPASGQTETGQPVVPPALYRWPSFHLLQPLLTIVNSNFLSKKNQPADGSGFSRTLRSAPLDDCDVRRCCYTSLDAMLMMMRCRSSEQWQVPHRIIRLRWEGSATEELTGRKMRPVVWPKMDNLERVDSSSVCGRRTTANVLKREEVPILLKSPWG